MFRKHKSDIAYTCANYPRIRRWYGVYHALMAFCCTTVAVLLVHYEWFWDARMGGATSIFNRIVIVLCMGVSIYALSVLHIVYSCRKQLAP